MTRLEQLDFENEEKFLNALKKVVNGEEAFRTFTGANNEPVKKKVISNNKLYLGQYALRINKANNGKIYLSIDYFSFDDRMAIYEKKKKDNKPTEV